MGLRRGADQPRFVPAYGDTLPAGVLAFLGSMDVREVIEGLALSAWGVGGLYLANRYRIRDEWRERVGRSRWGWDKRTSRRAREMGEAQWVHMDRNSIHLSLDSASSHPLDSGTCHLEESIT